MLIIAPSERMVPDSFIGAERQERGYKLKHKKLHLNMRKNFFALRVAEHYNRLPARSWSFLLSRHSSPT